MIVNKVTKKNLIEHCKKQLGTYNIDLLEKNNIRRDSTKYCFSATYPPLKVMKDTSPEEIFSEIKNKNRTFDLYFHFPFCTGRCSFCHFSPLLLPRQQVVNQYINLLKRELQLVLKRLGKIKVNSVYFGGGSPSLISSSEVAKIMEEVNEKVVLRPSALTTMEIHPEINQKNPEKYLSELKKSRINRLSIGVQDFNDCVLKAINRRHTTREAIKTIRIAQRIGFYINIDLLSPLPYQTLKSWEETINTAFNLKPDSVTLYTTAIRKNMPIYQIYKRKKEIFPSKNNSFIMYLLTQELAKLNNYKENPPGWFVKKQNKTGGKIDSLKKIIENLISSIFNKIGESGCAEIPQSLGFGPTAYSYFNNYHYYNNPVISRYILLIKNKKLPIWKGIRLSKKERFIREIIFSIKRGCLRQKSLEEKFGFDIDKIYKNELKILKKLHLIKRLSEDEIQLTQKGCMFSDEIATKFVSKKVKEKLKKELYKKQPDRGLIETYNFFYEI